MFEGTDENSNTSSCFVHRKDPFHCSAVPRRHRRSGVTFYPQRRRPIFHGYTHTNLHLDRAALILQTEKKTQLQKWKIRTPCASPSTDLWIRWHQSAMTGSAEQQPETPRRVRSSEPGRSSVSSRGCASVTPVRCGASVRSPQVLWRQHETVPRHPPVDRLS